MILIDMGNNSSASLLSLPEDEYYDDAHVCSADERNCFYL
jgi:hypothetical protein